MGFEALLGNRQLKENLAQTVKKGRIAHFYLICGPRGSGKHTLSGLLAAAALCREPEKPCLRCSHCRKVLSLNHPDYITVDDPEKKTVPVDLIRKAREDMFVRPNEGDRKIYLFPRAQDMGVSSQNALLKILEEPPAYGVFLLLTDNPEKLLPTIRSRCEELRLQPLPEDILKQELSRRFPGTQPERLAAAATRSGGYLGQAAAFLEDQNRWDQATGFLMEYASSDTLALLRRLTALEKAKREIFLGELESWIALCHEALLCRSGMSAGSREVAKAAAMKGPEQWNRAIELLRQGMDYARGNVSVAAICGWLSWALR